MSTIDYKDALDYHKKNKPGKIGIQITKPLDTQKNISMAYSPGVAEPVKLISEDPKLAYQYTSKGNLVGVITNGSAILGLGNRGALAAKPVMEGKVMLFKTFANIDAFDIEINETNPKKIINIIKAISPTFGAINLEDIKAPDCFIIEKELNESLDIPVFHDDQHGTAITIAAALSNALEIQNKIKTNVKIIIMGAGASSLATASFLINHFGIKKEQIRLFDSLGIISNKRIDISSYKKKFSIHTKDKTISDAMQGADVFIGLSGAKIKRPSSILKAMQPNPIIFPLSNPDPEINIDLIHNTRPDAIVATGRSDLPNQVNNALCFPYIFRAALDLGVNSIDEKMKIATVDALIKLAKEPIAKELYLIYPRTKHLTYGKNYIIPFLFDPRLQSFVVNYIKSNYSKIKNM